MNNLFKFLFDNNKSNNALCINDRYYTYDEFSKTIFSIANQINKNAKCQEKIGVYLTDSMYTYASIYAIWLTGNIYVPLHKSYPKSRLEDIAELSNLAMILTSEFGENIPKNHLIIDSTILNDFSVVKPFEHSNSDLMYILFTSGSTGVPKGVQISHGNLVSFFNEIKFLNFDVSREAGYLQPFDLTFDLSIVSTILPLTNGGVLYHVSSDTVKYLEIYRLLEDYAIEFAIIVPSVLNMLKQYFDTIHLDNLKIVALSGEAVPLELTQKWQQCCPNARFFNFYGPTECTIFCTCYEIPRTDIRHQNGIVSIGKPTFDLFGVLLDENLDEISKGEKGELWIGGDQVSVGYLNNNELNLLLFKDLKGVRYYNTGDIVQSDNDNYLFYLGRKDHQIKRNGFRIELSEIEYKSSLALDCQVCVISKVSSNTVDIILVLEVNQHERSVIVSKLNEQLPAFMIPNIIFEVKEFPLNDNGKLDRKQILEIYEQSEFNN